MRQDAMRYGYSMFARQMGRVAALAACATIAAWNAGCANKGDELVRPTVTQSPFPVEQGEVLIAVAPPMNESGVSTVDVLAVGDELVGAVSEARGLSAVPMNRTIAAMVSKGLSGIRSPMDAKVLAEALGVDGVVVSSITAYDPYDPPKIGMSLALFMMDSKSAPALDPGELTAAYTDQRPGPRTTFTDRPAAVAIEHLDASSHEVLIELKEFAKGRHDPKSALTWRRYTASMELYTQFAAYHTVRRLLDKESDRRGPVAAAPSEGKDTR